MNTADKVDYVLSQRLIDALTTYKTSGVFAALNPVKVVVLPKPEPVPLEYDAANAPF